MGPGPQSSYELHACFAIFDSRGQLAVPWMYRVHGTRGYNNRGVVGGEPRAQSRDHDTRSGRNARVGGNTGNVPRVR